MSVLYMNFGSKVGPRTFGCVAAISSAVLLILRCRLLLYSAGSGVKSASYFV